MAIRAQIEEDLARALNPFSRANHDVNSVSCLPISDFVLTISTHISSSTAAAVYVAGQERQADVAVLQGALA